MADSTNKATLTLIITKKGIESADGQHFELDELIKHSKNYEPQYVDFVRKGKEPKRKDYEQEARGENLYQAMLLLAFEVFETDFDGLKRKGLEDFPVCQFTYHKEVHKGISRKSNDSPGAKPATKYKDKFFTYPVFKGEPFAPIVFAQKCLKEFGEENDRFVLTGYMAYCNPCSPKLINSKNLILRGAPGTGKTYLAKEIAADIISLGMQDYENLTDGQKEQVGFVQFHPSYDYSDFVEGLRPKANDDGTMGFELKDGIFKKFVEKAKKNESKDFVFIIDEINRGDISKIFGELFFSIDPGYRGKAGEITTQYSNMHSDLDESDSGKTDSDKTDSDKKFYIPENVYIIGTMNDIDRSVDSFDFAMLRRFRFIEIAADDNESLKMLDSLDGLKTEAANRMKALNNAIASTKYLNKDYQIGAAYFLKLKDIDGDFDLLWKDYLQPLLQEYIRGFNDEEGLMKKFETAYGHETSAKSD